jgi:hypothetical protein
VHYFSPVIEGPVIEGIESAPVSESYLKHLRRKLVGIGPTV